MWFVGTDWRWRDRVTGVAFADPAMGLPLFEFQNAEDKYRQFNWRDLFDNQKN
jgi:hypothetical protein